MAQNVGGLPTFKFIKNFKSKFSLKAQNKSIIFQNYINENAMPDFDVSILRMSYQFKRADLRELLVCSIDPEGCTDVDDAISV